MIQAIDKKLKTRRIMRSLESDDSTLRVDITSRLPIDSQTVELLTFAPPMGDSPKSMLVVAYRFLNPHCSRHKVFNPLDVPVICCLCLSDISCILAARGTSTKILEVVVDEVIKWDNTMTSGVRESARDVYSKRRIIAVTKLKIVEWHNYKHLDWITVRGDDDKLYKFKEGYFKRLRIQDIEDMLLLLVQGKLTNLTVEERFALNVSHRMFTRSIVIQRRMEDLQLGVESYQKKLNLTRSDMYRSDLKRKESYIAYSNPRGFIYKNKDKQNMLMRIDELHKFSDGTLTDVRTALDDLLKGIRMKYLPQTIWSKSDKD
nr:hypothetical protein [Tanacetum cinerariifolium]